MPTQYGNTEINTGANTYIYYPGIDINSSGQIGMSYMKSGTDTSTDYLSMWVTARFPPSRTPKEIGPMRRRGASIVWCSASWPSQSAR